MEAGKNRVERHVSASSKRRFHSLLLMFVSRGEYKEWPLKQSTAITSKIVSSLVDAERVHLSVRIVCPGIQSFSALGEGDDGMWLTW